MMVMMRRLRLRDEGQEREQQGKSEGAAHRDGTFKKGKVM
jgi:hypothetical protein